jgi:hypothetical protein
VEEVVAHQRVSLGDLRRRWPWLAAAGCGFFEGGEDWRSGVIVGPMGSCRSLRFGPLSPRFSREWVTDVAIGGASAGRRVGWHW